MHCKSHSYSIKSILLPFGFSSAKAAKPLATPDDNLLVYDVILPILLLCASGEVYMVRFWLVSELTIVALHLCFLMFLCCLY